MPAPSASENHTPAVNLTQLGKLYVEQGDLPSRQACTPSLTSLMTININASSSPNIFVAHSEPLVIYQPRLYPVSPSHPALTGHS